MTTTTTFTINTGLSPAHTSGKVVSLNKGRYGHAEGNTNTVVSDSGHAEGSNNTASAISAHAEGDHTTASGSYAHAEGYYTTASAIAAHAEGNYTTSSAQYAHAEGNYATASAQGAHASGYYSTANKQYQRALSSGRFSVSGDSQYTEIVLRRATADDVPAELTIDGAAPSGTVGEQQQPLHLRDGQDLRLPGDDRRTQVGRHLGLLPAASACEECHQHGLVGRDGADGRR